MDPIGEDRFYDLVEQALAELPEAIARQLDNVGVFIEDSDPTEPDLLGLYEGIPQTERWDYAGVLPDKITIYRLPLCDMAADEAELIEEVKVTVVHEVAHHLGIDDEALHEMGWG